MCSSDLGRKPVGDVADVIVQAEELVQDNELAARRDGWRGPIGRQHVTIAGGQNDILFHHALHRFMMAPNRGILHREFAQETIRHGPLPA